MFAEHIVLLQRRRRRRGRVQTVTFQFWGADVSAAVPQRRLAERTWGFYFGIRWRLLGLLSSVAGRGTVGDLIVARDAGSSVTVGQLTRVVPLKSRVAGRVVDHLTGAGLMLDGESEGPSRAGAVRLEARRSLG